ncbi:right-handed parallel beta-helix repeat-containing protein [Cryobacterium sp. BB307]|uniref:right-handed parallel beta-helix repeat-containing protein n=1 Tax=Cryobacterium sp. BB307 TaxID=2716317 RepID=UPI00144850B8|nr:right-handed parallel beta-helix repeat-containing protein [Cryobacterium sp. BB307]
MSRHAGGQDAAATRKTVKLAATVGAASAVVAGLVALPMLTGGRTGGDRAPNPNPTSEPSASREVTMPASPFAGAANTGPLAAGFNPTQPYTGPMTITQSGTVIRDKVIPAGLRVEADNVTIQGNLITGPTDPDWDQAALHVEGRNVEIIDNEIRGESATDWRMTPVNGVKLVGDGVDFSRNNVHQIAGDGVSLYGAGANVVGNWVHDFVLRDGGVHYDGLHYPLDSLAGAGLIKDNTVELWITDSADSGMTAAIAIPDSSPGLVVEHNLIAGGNYALMGGGAGAVFQGNAFWTKFSSKVGYFGAVAYVGDHGTVEWTGNAYSDDGATTKGSVRP